MANNVILSPKYSLGLRDFLKGGLLAVLSAVVPIIQQSLERGELTFNWKSIGIVALGAFVAYIAKNWLLEPAQVTTTYGADNNKATEVAVDVSKKADAKN